MCSTDPPACAGDDDRSSIEMSHPDMVPHQPVPAPPEAARGAGSNSCGLPPVVSVMTDSTIIDIRRADDRFHTRIGWLDSKSSSG